MKKTHSNIKYMNMYFDVLEHKPIRGNALHDTLESALKADDGPNICFLLKYLGAVKIDLDALIKE